MPNWKKVIVSGSDASLNSLTVSNGITGSLYGTASWADSASWAPMRAGGLDTQIQFNSGSTLSGSANFKFIYASQSLQQGNFNVAYGQWSHAEGNNNYAAGIASHAEGDNTYAISYYSHTEGFQSIAGLRTTFDSETITTAIIGASSEVISSLEGDYTNQFPAATKVVSVRDDYTFGFVDTVFSSSYDGTYTTVYFTTAPTASTVFYLIDEATGGRAHAEGQSTVAGAVAAHAEGESTKALGNYSHAEGQSSRTFGVGSHAEGGDTQAKGEGAHSEGLQTIASGSFSHSEGLQTLALGEYSHAEGSSTVSVFGFGHAEGSYSIAGNYSHAEGEGTVAAGTRSHAEGIYTVVGYKTDFVDSNTSATLELGSSSEITIPLSGDITSYFQQTNEVFILSDGLTYITNDVIFSSSFNGTDTTVFFTNLPTGSYVGYLVNVAFGLYAHAEGAGTQAIGSYAHAEGENTKAIGLGSHAAGYSTIASGSYQSVIGQYNIPSSYQSAFIIGNGTSNSVRSNLLFASGSEFQISGSLFISGAQQAGGNNNLLTWNPTTGLVTYTTGSIVISGSISGVDYIDFDLNPGVANAAGRLYFDSGNGTLQIGLVGGNVVANIGQDLYQYVYNDTGTTLTKGQVVYVSGSQGNRIAVKLASAIDDANSAATLGFVAETITVGAEGWVQTEGTLKKLDTTGLVGGQLLYLSSSAGQYTQVKPVSPIHEVRLGYAERIDNTVGSIYIKIDNGYEIGELHDVIDTTTTSSYGDLLVKSGSIWISSNQLTGSYGLTGSLTATSFTGSLSGTASYANNADLLDGIDSSRFATTGSNTFTANQIISGSLTVRDNLIVLGSASMQYISESTLNIGTNLITVNTFNPSIRFGGIAVIDSGSSGGSGSFLYDSVQDEFIFVHRGVPGQITSSHFILGPETYNNLGNETYLSQNRLPKGTGIEHLVDSNITDTGTNVSINSNTQITGSLTISGSIEAAYKSPYTTQSAAYTASIFDSTIEYTSGNVTCSLYAAAGNTGRQLYIKNDGTGVITVDAHTTETIDGQLTRRLAQYEDLLIQADGVSNWIILNRKPVTMHFEHLDVSPTDTTTYYIGNYPWAAPPTTSNISRQVRVTTSGWIRYITVLVVVATTIGTSEDSTLLIRNVTTATNSTVTTALEHNAQFQNLTFTLATPLQVTRGDLIEFIWTTPNWGTNPTAVRHLIHALIE